MDKKKRRIRLIIWLVLLAVFLVLSIVLKKPGEHEQLKEAMRDAVLHEDNKVSLFGIKTVNPAVISAMTLTGILLFVAAVLRIFVIPKFKMVPGKVQLLLEEAVGFFDNLAKTNSPHRNGFLGAYLFGAGAYIFFGTLFELFGFEAVTTNGRAISLPAPLSDINGAICLGVLSYLVIMSGGIADNKIKGIGYTLKEFSLPISMSFRLFGALLSGLLVTELVYFNVALSYVLPVFVAVIFTLIHAIVQTYVLTMLTALFYGEVSEPKTKKPKKTKKQAAA